MDKKARGKWTSSFGFIMAAAGSAVGLGNLWKFPYMAGNNGGGLFVLIYTVIMLTIGVTLILGEMTIGRAKQKNAFGSYRAINKHFGFVGGIGVVAGFLILSFYSAIGGWVIKYLVTYVTGTAIGDSAAFYQSFTESPVATVAYQLLFLALTALIVRGGIAGGIEKASKFMMPTLLIFLVVLAVRALTLPGATEGVSFFLKPDFSKLSPELVFNAMGQVFFSLSLGMGTLVTYGSYIPKSQNMQKTAVAVPVIDLLVALIAGLAILPSVFAFHLEPTVGPGLTFVTLPQVFSAMPFGGLFGILFFILLLFAALTSSISMLEVLVACGSEELHWPRKKTVWGVTALTVLLAIPCALSTNLLADVKLFGKTVFDLFDFVASNVLMPLGGLLMCIVIGFVWGPKKAVYEITNEGKLTFHLSGVWSFLISYLAPIVIFLIFLSSIGVF